MNIKNENGTEYHSSLERRHWKAVKRKRLLKERRKKQFDLLKDKTPEEVEEIKRFSRYIHVIAPTNFTFLSNTEDTINFINLLERNLILGKPVFVHLTKVKTIDYAAITVLLSVMFLFKKRRIRFNGDLPNSREVKSKLMDSQFFDHLTKNKISSGSIHKDNQIFGKGNKVVEPVLGYKLIIQSSETIWGTRRMCKGLQRVLIELMQNTHAHAVAGKTGEEYWWLSVNHDSNNKKVSFGFVDYGQGIFESFINKPANSKWANMLQKAKLILKHGTNTEILQKLLEGDLHFTVTGQKFRGKGLPGIREVMLRNQISNLHIISNNVFSDVKDSHYHQLNRMFKGTFIYWELCYNNENKVWNI